MEYLYSIVIPCYNEYDNLEALVSLLKSEFRGYPTEFILVENGSTDGSRQWIKNSKEIDGETIKACYVDVNRGYGYGIIQGLKECTGTYVGWLHADFQVSPLELKKIFRYLERRKYPHNIMIKGIRKGRKMTERFFAFGMSLCMVLILRKRLVDINAVPVLIDNKFSNELIENAQYGLDFDLYAYYQAKVSKCKIKRFDVAYGERLEGDSSWNKGVKSQLTAGVLLVKKAFLIKRNRRE